MTYLQKASQTSLSTGFTISYSQKKLVSKELFFTVSL